MIYLTNNEWTALSAWSSYPEDFDVLSFYMVHHNSTLEKRLVRRTVRALARKGVVEYIRSTMNEDGELSGAGYRPTKEGRKLLSMFKNE